MLWLCALVCVVFLFTDFVLSHSWAFYCVRTLFTICKHTYQVGQKVQYIRISLYVDLIVYRSLYKLLLYACAIQRSVPFAKVIRLWVNATTSFGVVWSKCLGNFSLVPSLWYTVWFLVRVINVSECFGA